MSTPLRRTRNILAQLRAGAEPGQRLYALVDCAHHTTLYNRLAGVGARTACLFDDYELPHVQEAAPHLVELGDPLTWAGIVGEGHGRAWCSYVRSAAAFDSLANHLRRYVKCRMRDSRGRGQDAYFAFWDPRVAADWLPVLGPDEASQFFAQVDAFFGEVAAQPDTLIRYRYDRGDAVVRIEPLSLAHEGSHA